MLTPHEEQCMWPPPLLSFLSQILGLCSSTFSGVHIPTPMPRWYCLGVFYCCCSCYHVSACCHLSCPDTSHQCCGWPSSLITLSGRLMMVELPLLATCLMSNRGLYCQPSSGCLDFKINIMPASGWHAPHGSSAPKWCRVGKSVCLTWRCKSGC